LARLTYLPIDKYHPFGGLGVFKSPLKLTLFMVTVGLQVRLEAKPGKEQVVADFLKSALPLAQNEPATVTWYAVQLGPSTFGIFDTFPDDAGRQAHLNGPIAAALMANAAELLSSDPVIEMVDILAAK
jgi:quinol monooxygenase YgiN